MNPVAAVDWVARILAELGSYGYTVEDVSTGEHDGVERAVRYLLPTARVFVGRENFDERNAVAALAEESVVFIHPDPLVSHMYTSVAKHWDEPDIHLVVPS